MKTQKEMVQRLRAYMEDNEKTQSEIALSLGCSQSCVSAWLSGARNIGAKYYIALYRLLEGGSND